MQSTVDNSNQDTKMNTMAITRKKEKRKKNY